MDGEDQDDLPEVYRDNKKLNDPKVKDSFRPSRQKRCALNLRNMNPEVKRQFKAYCAQRGYDMYKAIEYLMREATRKKRILNLPR